MANPLARIIMEKNLKMETGRIKKSSYEDSKPTLSKSGSNLTEEDICLIKQIIHDERQVLEERDNSRPISLEEAVNRAKNSR